MPIASRPERMAVTTASTTRIAISLVLVYVINRQSFHWSMELHPPYLLLAGFVTTLVVLAVLTAMVSGREAMGMGPVRAVREDW